MESGDEAGRQRVLAFIREQAPELEEMTSRLMTVIRTRRTTGLTDPEQTVAVSKERLFDAITQVLLFVSKEAPVVVLLDDLQWADSGSLQLFHYIARSARDRRLLFLGTYRTEDLLPEGEGTAHPLVDTMQRMSREELFRKIELEGLGPEGVNLMVRFILRRAVFSADFQASLYRETGGNPFFVIEVLKLLRDEGVITERRGVWRERREITRADIPERVYDVVIRRIERLTDDQRELLQIASVAGSRFISGALENIAATKRVRVLQTLNRLERLHQLIRSEADAYLFSHQKIREILYDEIPPELRREYHLAYGTYLEGEVTQGGREPVTDLAYHFFFGGAHARALPYLVRAGDASGRVFAYREARDYYRWANEALSGDGDIPDREALEGALLYKLGFMSSRLGDIPTALDCLQRSAEAAERAGDLQLTARAQERVGQIHARSGQYGLATRQYRKSIENFGKLGDQKALCEILVRAANIPFEQGDWKRVQSYYTRALRIARQTNHRQQIATIHMNSGIMASIRGDVGRALSRYEKSRAIYEEVNDQAGLAKVYLNLGWSYAGQKEWERAREAYQQALEISQETRNILQEAECYLNLAEVLLETADLRGSKRACVKALEIFKKLNNQLGIADIFKTLGQVATAERKWEEARSYFEESISRNEALGHGLGAGGGHLEYARMLKALGDLDVAVAEIDRSVAWFEKVDAKEELNAVQDLRKEIEALQYLIDV